ncbi:Nucleotidylyl transferase [Apiospora arundinis]|uniref:Nucleotidylyl transferase n=1 Tax=Apiospora arundinis TaxID=335852 RepID=A0ABR2IEJ9_9PEZI
MSASDVTDTEAMSFSRPLPPNLVSHFTQALKAFQLSETTFSVLCSVSSAHGSNHGGTTATPVVAPIPPKQTPRTLVVLDSSFNPPTLAHQRMALSALADQHQPQRQDSSRDSRVLLLLAINNADKAPKPAAFPQRLAMMYVFAQDLLAAARKHHYQTVSPSSDEKGGGSARHEEEEEAVDIAVTTEPYFHSKSNAIATSEYYTAAAAGVECRPMMEQLYLTGFDTLIRIFDAKYYPNDTMRQALDPFLSQSRLRVTMRTDADWGSATDQRAYLAGLRDGRLEAMGGKREWADRVDMVEGRKEGEEGGGEVISSTKVRGAVQREDWPALRRLVSEGVGEWVKTQGLYKEDA